LKCDRIDLGDPQYRRDVRSHPSPSPALFWLPVLDQVRTEDRSLSEHVFEPRQQLREGLKRLTTLQELLLISSSRNNLSSVQCNPHDRSV
jgi:hypothetical protein